jgi:Secretion system C-terminal sorting domain/Pregnancy-associated plasma protein-A
MCGTNTSLIDCLPDRDINLQINQHTFKVNIIVVTTQDGFTSVSQNDLNNLRNNLASDFFSANIFFRFNECIEYYKNGDLYCKGISETDINSKISLDAINIWVGAKTPAYGNCLEFYQKPKGLSHQNTMTGAKAIMIQGSFNNTNTPALNTHLASHQMGHLFGLIHTFDNTSCNVHETDPFYQGDKISDTKEEVFGTMSFPGSNCIPNNPCIYQDISKYSNPQNLMNTPANISCANEFTFHQKAKMHAFISKYYQESFYNCSDLPDNPIIFEKTKYLTCCEYRTDRNIMVKNQAELLITGAKLLLGENTNITIEQGSKLLSDNSTYTTSFCNSKWDGIHIVGNSNASQPDFRNISSQQRDDGAIIASDNDIFENANIALNTNVDDPKKWGGLILVSRSTFKNNWKDAQFMYYTFPDQSTFSSCIFIEGKHGVTIWADHGVEFNHCKFLDKEGYGIYSILGYYNIFDCDFESNNIGVGVDGDGFQTSQVLLRQNRFVYNKYAGLVENSSLVNSYEDVFTSNFESWGAKYNGASSYVLQRDTIIGGIGVSINSTDLKARSANAWMHKCKLIGNIAGIHVQGQNNTDFTCNDFKGGLFDLVLDGRDPTLNSASIQTDQFYGNLPENCFGSVVGLDIWTLGNTDRFNYYIDGNNTCTTPRNTGNFNTPLPNFPFQVCLQGENEDYSETRLDEVKVSLNSNLSVYEKDKLFTEKKLIINYLVDSLFKINDSLKIAAIINNEAPTDFINEMRLKLAYKRKDFILARNLINNELNYSETNKKLKLLYLDKIATGYNINNYLDYSFIKSVAISKVPESTLARTLLTFVFDETILDSFPDFPISNQSNLRKKDVVISSIDISPNPAYNYITINGLNSSQIYKAELISINGNILRTETIKNSEELDISSLNPGFYILKLYSNNQILKILKFIKI